MGKERYAAKKSADHRRDMQTVERGAVHAYLVVHSRGLEPYGFDNQVPRRPE